MDLSREAQLSRSPGGSRRCPDSGELRRSCDCYRCQGARNRRKGQRKQREARKQADRWFGRAGPTRGVTANEENWRHRVRIEAKSGKQVQALVTRFLAAETQAEEARAIGDNRPFVFAAAPDGMSDQIWAFRMSDLPAIVEAFRG